MHSTTKNKLVAGATLGVIVVVIAIGLVAFSPKQVASDTVTTATPIPAPTSPPPSSSTPAAAQTYRDGTYTATVSYDSPGGTEKIGFSLTLKGDVVTATTAQPGATDPTAKEYQNDFIGGYQAAVVGKSLASLQLSRVSGSSLTSQGFNAAVAKIKTQAQA